MVETGWQRSACPLLLVIVVGLGCREREAERPRTARIDTLADTSAQAARAATESEFLRWWRRHARRVALQLPQKDAEPPVTDLARYALVGADTTVVGSPEPIEVLDLERPHATLPGVQGTYQVYAFPEWERQLKLWVPEGGDRCAKQRAALVVGSGEPVFFEMNPLCQAANVQYDIDGVSITAYYPRGDSVPWIEFTYQTPRCPPLYLFRWSTERERLEPVRAVRSCQDVQPQ